MDGGQRRRGADETGDFLPQPGWNWHGHRNAATTAMAWLDGLDIPLQSWLESTFFEFGADRVAGDDVPVRSRSERLWSHPGLRPLADGAEPASTPLLAYRWEHTDRALSEQLALEDDGHRVTVEPGHAAVRYTNPATAGDALPTIRAEFHRFRPGASSTPRRDVGSSVFQVFDGEADVQVGEATWQVGRGDLFVVPSWQPWTVRCDATAVDLFRFSDAPVYERLGLHPGAPTRRRARPGSAAYEAGDDPIPRRRHHGDPGDRDRGHRRAAQHGACDVNTTLWLDELTVTFLRVVDTLPDDGFIAPTALPGWTRAHVVAHVHFNALALRRLVSSARTGDEVPMYASPNQRADEIERGADDTPARLRGLVHDSARALSRDLADLSPAQLERTIVTAQGRHLPAPTSRGCAVASSLCTPSTSTPA